MSGGEDALAHWEFIQESNPDDVEACIQLMQAHADLGNQEIARQHMVELEDKFPEDWNVLHRCAILLLKWGDSKSARRRWEAVCNGLTEDLEPHISLASLNLKDNNLEGAEQLVDRVLNRHPDDIRTLILKAKIKQKNDDWPAALELWKRINGKRKITMNLIFK